MKQKNSEGRSVRRAALSYAQRQVGYYTQKAVQELPKGLAHPDYQKAKYRMERWRLHAARLQRVVIADESHHDVK